MMRSMYSAVSGLKTHQTRMDVIGNNIANVNTVAFKGSSVTFSDILYQTTSSASGANATTGTGGVNAKQIGLGVTTAATSVSITTSGAAETTGNPFDIRLTDKNSTNFFIVNDGTQNLFTRAGSFYVDGSGNLCMTSTGYTVMGWQVDPTTGDIRKDTVSALRIMKESNLTSAPEATTLAAASGVLDKNDTDVESTDGKVLVLNFYDKLGYQYTAKFAVKSTTDAAGNTSTDTGTYTIQLTSILNSENENILAGLTATQIQSIFGSSTGLTEETATSRAVSNLNDNGYTTTDGGQTITDAAGVNYEFHDADGTTYMFPCYVSTDGNNTILSLGQTYGVSDTYLQYLDMSNSNYDVDYSVSFDANGNLNILREVATYTLQFDTSTGLFSSIGGGDSVTLNMESAVINGRGNFESVNVDFSQVLWYNNGGKSTVSIDSGSVEDGTTGKGRKLGAMTGISIDTSGKIWGSYDNGNTELLGQIAVAQFANASGLEKVGDSCYQTTLNSGEFDGVGVEISADGSSMTTGELEMSNVDLSQEFTQMITTQRGFQANSRVITTSDTLLEELVNLKR